MPWVCHTRVDFGVLFGWLCLLREVPEVVLASLGAGVRYGGYHSPTDSASA